MVSSTSDRNPLRFQGARATPSALSDPPTVSRPPLAESLPLAAGTPLVSGTPLSARLPLTVSLPAAGFARVETAGTEREAGDPFIAGLRDLRAALAALFRLMGMSPAEAAGVADRAVAGEDLPKGQDEAVPATGGTAAASLGLAGIAVEDGAAARLGEAMAKGAQALHGELIALLMRLGLDPSAARIAASRLLAGIAAAGGTGGASPASLLADIRRGVPPAAGAVGLAVGVKDLTLSRDATHVHLHLDSLVLRGFPLASDGVRLVRADASGTRLTADLVIPTGVPLEGEGGLSRRRAP